MTDYSEIILDTSFDISTAQTKENYTVERPRSSSNHNEFLLKSKKNDTLVLKVYEFKNSNPSISFLNESRFKTLNHMNITSIVHTINKHHLVSNAGVNTQCSLVVTEPGLCSLRELITSTKFNSKMVRTIFLQILNGLCYLNSKGISHMNLNLDNILLGADYSIKIGNFEFAYKTGDLLIQGDGSKNFRAPEIMNKECRDAEPADVYSLAIILYCLKFGSLPYREDEMLRGKDFMNDLMDKPKTYWENMESFFRVKSPSDEFKGLIQAMVTRDPSKRIRLNQIKESNWLLKPVYSVNEFREILKSRI